MSPAPVLLASTSRYRRELLARLLPGFETFDPGIDESRQSDEVPAALALRLAAAKAAAGTLAVPGSIVIGSDQVAALDDVVLGKPGGPDRALEQLRACSGCSVVFHTAVCVIAPGQQSTETHVDLTEVHFRQLSDAELRRYLEREQPWDCAGSFKSEGLGAALMTRIDNQDPTALQGLPLIWLAACLRRLGLQVP